MNDHLHALPTGHLLGEYRIDGVLGSGGFGITYLAWDIHLDKPVAIKEYLPGEFALRTDATTVKPKSTADQDAYQWGLARFMDEARALARFKHPHLNEVYRFLEGNGTAYMVLEYIEGETLAALLKREGQLDPARLRRLLDELLSGLEQVHATGYVHRDIKPGNIMLRPDGAAVLLDFGAARQAIGQRSKSITSILTPGYAPIEQYDQNATDVGPWTDLYALGMVAYRCLSGINDSGLPDAVTRSRLERKGEQHKDLAPAVEVGKGRHSQALLEAVDWAMRVDEEQRPQSVAAIKQALAGDDKPATVPPSTNAADQSPRTQKKRPGKRWGIGLVSALAAGTVVTLGWPIVQEQLHWQEVKCNDETALRRHLDAYPDGRHRPAARSCLAGILEAKHKAEEENARVKRQAEAMRQAEEERAAREKRQAEAKRKAEEERAAREKRQAEAKRKAEEERAAREKRQAEAKQPGKVFRDCRQCPEMVVLPAGAFLMGSPATEEERYDDEGPQHRVTIAKPFAVGKYEVTFAEWDACRRAGGCSHNPNDSREWGRGNRPVIDMSWDDAQEYVRWLSREIGKQYRLLSESEWEYAARAGTTTPFHFGATISTGQANYNGNFIYGSGRKGAWRRRTVAVGSFPANHFGLHDMHGNVREWVEDCWHDSYAGAPADGSAWTRGGDCGGRVLRGGSWIDYPGLLRSAVRYRYATGLRFILTGFRVARTLTP